MQPLCRMDFVSLQRPRVWIDTRKLYVLAEVIPAVVTEEALFAGNAGLDGYPVALEVSVCNSYIEILRSHSHRA
jgi:hypothetical protein